MTAIKRKYSLFGIPLFQTEKRFQENSKNIATNKDVSILKIAFVNGGGMGDAIIDVAFIQNLTKFLPRNTTIDYYARAGNLFKYCPFLTHCYNNTNVDKSKYDVILANHRYYMIWKFDKHKTKMYSPVLYNFCEYCLNLRNNTLKNNYDNNNLYSQYAELFGKNRWEQLDLHAITGFDRNNEVYLPILPEYFSIFTKCKIKPQEYITINRGVDDKLPESNPKLWPLEYYQKLVKLLKDRYPNLKILQIGKNTRYGIIGADLNLLGLTDIEETKILIKNALIHIDIEGGLVHLNHVLHGTSCVIFGATPIRPLKYEENINIKNNACPHFCDWVIQSWQQSCLRGYIVPPCMAETTPEIVLTKIVEFINNRPNYKYNKEEITKIDLSNKNIAVIGDVDFTILTRLSISNKITVYKNCFTPDYPFKQEYGSPFNLPLKNNSIDAVLWYQPENANHQDLCLLELKRVIKTGGCIITKNCTETFLPFSVKSNALIKIIKRI